MKRFAILAAVLMGLVIITDLAESGVDDPPLTAVEISVILPQQTDPDNPEVGVGDMVAFVAQATGGQGEIVYDWEFGDGATLFNGIVVSHTYVEAASYTVSVFATDTYSGTTAYDELILTVLPNTNPTKQSSWGCIKALFHD